MSRGMPFSATVFVVSDASLSLWMFMFTAVVVLSAQVARSSEVAGGEREDASDSSSVSESQAESEGRSVEAVVVGETHRASSANR